MTQPTQLRLPEEEQNGIYAQSGSVSPLLPEIPSADLDLTLEVELTLDSRMPTSDPQLSKVQKRASNVMKMAQENEKLKAELRGMSERLEAIERKRLEMARKKQLEQESHEEEEEEEEDEHDEQQQHEPTHSNPSDYVQPGHAY